MGYITKHFRPTLWERVNGGLVTIFRPNTNANCDPFYFYIERGFDKESDKKGRHTTSLCFGEKVDEFFSSHKLHFSIPLEKDTNDYWITSNGDFKLFAYSEATIDDPSLEEELIKKARNNRFFRSKYWESCDQEPSGMFIEDSDKEYKKYQPYQLFYNSVSFSDEKGVACLDSAVLLVVGIYEIRVWIRNQLRTGAIEADKNFYGPDRKEKWPNKKYFTKYYFVKITNAKTKEEKSYNFLEENYVE